MTQLRTTVFIGPSIGIDAARQLLSDDAGSSVTFLPPVSQGDVTRAVTGGAQVIGIIDGYFERVPSVWHKEILWAMAEGVHVFGAASMGALRAAELSPFGMVGVGAVYASFASGDLTDDDEVAVAHASADDGYRPVSEAMVNIRATVRAALHEGVIPEETATAVIAVAKHLYYPMRSWPALLAFARDNQLVAIEDLAGWLPSGRVDQKGEDAQALLRVLRDFSSTSPGRKSVDYHLELTVPWEKAKALAVYSPEN